jgi:hypothetical protein
MGAHFLHMVGAMRCMGLTHSHGRRPSWGPCICTGLASAVLQEGKLVGGGGCLESALLCEPQKAQSFDDLALAPSPPIICAALSVSKNSLVPTVTSLLPTICQSQLL